MIDGFKKFIARGDMIDIAVGVVMGAAVTAVVNSIVNNLINPLIAMIFGNEPLMNAMDKKPLRMSKYIKQTKNNANITTIDI